MERKRLGMKGRMEKRRKRRKEENNEKRKIFPGENINYYN